jgi:hypothetical protein
VARANLDLYSLDRGILSRAQNNQTIQRQQGLVNSSGIPKSQTFFVRPSFSVFAAGGNQSTSTSAPQTFTSNFTNQATSQPTIFTTTATTTTTTTGGIQDLTSGFSSGFTSTLDSTATTTTTASGGGGVNDFNAYGDSREEPNRLAGEIAGDLILFISVIDEDDGYSQEQAELNWEELKSKNPLYYFVLLRVNQPAGIDGIIQFFPRSFKDDPNTVVIDVKRDTDENWFNLIPPNFFSDIGYISLLVDNSGSTVYDNVRVSAERFIRATENTFAFLPLPEQTQLPVTEYYLGAPILDMDPFENWIYLHTLVSPP